MPRHDPVLYAVAYLLFTSGILTWTALGYLNLLGVGANQAATALLLLGVLGAILFRPGAHSSDTPQFGPSPVISMTDVFNFGTVCAGLCLWSFLALVLV